MRPELKTIYPGNFETYQCRAYSVSYHETYSPYTERNGFTFDKILLVSADEAG